MKPVQCLKCDTVFTADPKDPWLGLRGKLRLDGKRAVFLCETCCGRYTPAGIERLMHRAMLKARGLR